jgi:tetratricopeptide (TPR) repeat protein
MTMPTHTPQTTPKICLLLCALLLCSTMLLLSTAPAGAQSQPVKWLIVPVRDLSGAGPAGIDAAVTKALVAKLGEVEGWKVRIHDPRGDVVQAAIEQGILTEKEAASAPDLASAQKLGLVWGADTVLLGVIVRREVEVANAQPAQMAVLTLNVVGIIGRQIAGPGKKIDLAPIEARVTEKTTADELAFALTQGLSTRLQQIMTDNPGLWRADPAAAAGWADDGARYMAAGRFREARLAFEAALRADPNAPQYRRQLAQALLSLGQPQDALAQLQKAQAQAPNDVDIHLALGDTYIALGNPAQALQEFEIAALPDKTALRPQVAIAHAHLILGDTTFALKSFAALAKKEPKDAAVHRGYAQALMAANRMEDAVGELKLATELDPKSRETRESFANLLLLRGKLADGVEQLRLLANDAPAPLSYSLADYRRLMRFIGEEYDLIDNEFPQRMTQYMQGALSQEQLVLATQALHKRSDNLARLLEHMAPPVEMSKSHDYWVLAANLLNQSDFETTRYAGNEGQDHLRRAQLFREACDEASAQARALAANAVSIPAVTTKRK